ncbi:MAG: thiamine diphosphokinase [Dysgonamonadaceae bacterium]|jgi:thiamine pyrophosphokinase|nr:thiamine diphosphokinase [Dysgonamonadaceae bacterium]
MEYKYIILADGLFPSSEQVQNLLKKAETIVCCDGAAQKLLDFGIEPQYIVGDLDSLSKEFKQRFAQKIIQNSDQETNDLTKAVEFCISKNWKQVAILGATGLREDHTLGNISLLCNYKKQLDEVVMISDFGIFTPIFETTIFKSFPEQQISVFSLNPETKLTFKGLEYPVENQSFTSWWQGTLNAALGDSFEIILHNKGEVIVYITF